LSLIYSQSNKKKAIKYLQQETKLKYVALPILKNEMSLHLDKNSVQTIMGYFR